MKKSMICIQCPRGCHLEMDLESKKVTGNSCPRGEKYALDEITCPKRTITSTVRIKGASIPRVSVRTSSPINKSLMFDVIKELDKVEVNAPCNVGDIVIHNVLDTGSDIIITKRLEKNDDVL